MRNVEKTLINQRAFQRTGVRLLTELQKHDAGEIFIIWIIDLSSLQTKTDIQSDAILSG